METASGSEIGKKFRLTGRFTLDREIMSLFFYHLLCDGCGTESQEYSFGGDFATPATLPAWSQKLGKFAAVEVPPRMGCDEAAASHTTDEVVVGVPYVDQLNRIKVRPIPFCPQCGGPVVAMWGPPAHAVPTSVCCDTIADAIRLHITKPNDHRNFHFDGCRLEVSEGWDESEAYRWHGWCEKEGCAETLAEQLRDCLRQHGRVTDKLRIRLHRDAFTMAELIQ